MKKLMIAAAAAAMIGGAYAALPDTKPSDDNAKGVGIMHNVAITVKTLMPTVTKSSSGCAICAESDACYLFEQGTLKINGIFASCGCEDMFEYGYFWLGSGKKATKLFDKLASTVRDYDELPAVADLGIKFTVNRYGKTMKKVVAKLNVEADGVKFDSVGFGSYTDAKYKYDKTNDEYTLKSTAKVSASGSVVGNVDTEKLALYLYDQGKLSAADAAEDFMLFDVDDGCTIDLECTDGTAATTVPLMGTFSVKAASVKALNKVIPAVCWAD